MALSLQIPMSAPHALPHHVAPPARSRALTPLPWNLRCSNGDHSLSDLWEVGPGTSLASTFCLYLAQPLRSHKPQGSPTPLSLLLLLKPSLQIASYLEASQESRSTLQWGEGKQAGAVVPLSHTVSQCRDLDQTAGHSLWNPTGACSSCGVPGHR